LYDIIVVQIGGGTCNLCALCEFNSTVVCIDTMNAYRQSGCMALLILNLDTR